MKNKVGIIGAGVGGLATAARLAFQGFDVEVFEKLPECGGRAHIIKDKGFKFDTGPSFILMPDFFEEIFVSCGESLKDYLDFKKLEISYKIFFPDGEELTVFSDSEETKAECEKFQKGVSKSFDEFIKVSGTIYDKVKPLLYKNITKKDFFNPSYWKLIPQIEIFKTYWQLVKKFFSNDKLAFAFTFEAMFIGVSPFKAPAFYSVISYADHKQKIYHPMGGMYEVPKALERMANKFGAKINYNSEIRKLYKENGALIIESEAGSKKFDKVISNADYVYTQSDILGRKIPKFDYSCSVFLIYLGLKQRLKGMEHHNLFFSKDLQKNLNQIFQDKSVPDDPSFYVHVPTVTDASLAPEGKEIVYILIPVPNLDKNKEDIRSKETELRKFAIDKINKIAGQKIEDLIEVEHKFYPQDFIDRYNIKYGATFGLGHTFWQSAFFRPSNQDTKLKNLFFVGASTQPGGGLPPVLASSKIVADLIANG